MNEKWGQVREKLTAFWNQYSKTQKWVLASSAALLVFIIVFLTVLFTRTEYEVAFNNMDATDSASIMQYLEGQGIPYKLSADGTSISVPSASVSRVKVDVGSQGLVVNGSMGFNDLSKDFSSLASTDQEIRVKYINALNGEVQQLLQGMQGVSRAKALVTLPEDVVFLNDSEKDHALAAIVMSFKPGYRPQQHDIDSYYNLVKTAVPNLPVDGITITSSTSGYLAPSPELGGNGSLSGGAQYESQMAIKQDFENDLKRNIQSFLLPLVGDNLVVNVVSALNFDQIDETQNLVQPLEGNNNNGIVLGQTTTTKTSESDSGQAGGVAGTGASEVTNYPSGSGGGTSSSEESSTTTNYDVNRITKNIDYGPYKVKDLSINVGIDSSAMTDDQKAEIQSVLLSAVDVLLAESGLDLSNEQLANRVHVVSQTFGGAGAGGSSGVSPSTLWLAAAGLLALALVGGGGYVVARRRKAAKEAAEIAAMPRQELPTIDIDSVSNESQVRKQLESLAKRKPEDFVNLLRTWLVDE